MTANEFGSDYRVAFSIITVSDWRKPSCRSIIILDIKYGDISGHRLSGVVV